MQRHCHLDLAGPVTQGFWVKKKKGSEGWFVGLVRVQIPCPNAAPLPPGSRWPCDTRFLCKKLVTRVVCWARLCPYAVPLPPGSRWPCDTRFLYKKLGKRVVCWARPCPYAVPLPLPPNPKCPNTVSKYRVQIQRHFHLDFAGPVTRIL